MHHGWWVSNLFNFLFLRDQPYQTCLGAFDIPTITIIVAFDKSPKNIFVLTIFGYDRPLCSKRAGQPGLGESVSLTFRFLTKILILSQPTLQLDELIIIFHGI